MIGITIIETTTPAMNSEPTKLDGCSVCRKCRNGMKPRWRASQLSVPMILGIRKIKPHRAKAMLGIAASRSMTAISGAAQPRRRVLGDVERRGQPGRG